MKIGGRLELTSTTRTETPSTVDVPAPKKDSSANVQKIDEDDFAWRTNDWPSAWAGCTSKFPKDTISQVLADDIERYSKQWQEFDQHGMVVFSRVWGRLPPSSVEQLKEMKKLLARSDVPLYFVLEMDEHDLRSIACYRDKSDWQQAIASRSSGVVPESIKSASLTSKQSQMEFIDSILKYYEPTPSEPTRLLT